MSKTVTFGEIMLRLSPNGYYRFFQDDQLQATFGGAEANAAVCLANFGMESKYITKLPDNPIGQGAINQLRYFGVDTSQISRGGDRIGIYFVEKGASQRPGICIYDRKNSSIQTASKEDFDWETILEGADFFYFTGITPALSETLAEICTEACIEAKKRGITVCFDSNYRSKLWTAQKASKVIGNFCKYIDICITNPGDAKDIFNVLPENSNFNLNDPDNDGCISIARQLVSRYGFKKTALTIRKSISASDNVFSGLLYDGNECCFSPKYSMHITDRVGGGDSFGAGLVYSLSENMNNSDTINFAVASAVLKHSIDGDFNRITADEVKKLANGDGHGRVQR